MKKILSLLLSVAMIFMSFTAVFTASAATKTTVVGRWDIKEYRLTVPDAYLSFAANSDGGTTTDEMLNLPYTGNITKIKTNLFKIFKKGSSTVVTPKFTIKVANENSKNVGIYKFTVTLNNDSFKTYQFEGNKQSKVYYYSLFPQAPTDFNISSNNTTEIMNISFKKGLGAESTEIYVGSTKDYFALDKVADTTAESVSLNFNSGDCADALYYRDYGFSDINRILFVSKKGSGTSETRSEVLEKKYLTNLPIVLSNTKYNCDGSNKKPGVTITNKYNLGEGKTIVKDRDYVVSYEPSCKTVGLHYVTVDYKGDYVGHRKVAYTILPKNTTMTKLTSPDLSLVVEWKKLSTETTGYQLHFSTKADFSNYKSVMINNVNTTKYTLNSLTHDTKEYVRIRTYKTVGNTKYFSAWSVGKYVTIRPILNGSKLTKLVSKQAKTVNVAWSKIGNATSYNVQYSTSKSFPSSNVKTKSLNKTSYTASNLKSKSTYCFRTRAIKEIKGKKYYGSWSAVKSIKVK